MKLRVAIDGRTFEVEVEDAADASGQIPSPTATETIQSAVLPTATKPGFSSAIDEAKVCRSPLAGVVVRLHANPGQPMQANDLLLVLDAMKMEIKITAQSAGTIKSIEVAPGDAVKPDQILVFFE